MTRGKSTPQPSGFLSGLAALVVMLALTLASGGAYLLMDRGARLEAEVLFAAVMDYAAGPGNWERGALTTSLVGDAITVENLVVRPRDPAVNDRFAAEKVVITGPMDAKEAGRFSRLRDWIGQPRTTFAEEVAISGVSSGSGGVAVFAKSIAIRRPALAESGPGNPPGPSGFLLSLAAESLAAEEVDVWLMDADEAASLSVSLLAIEGLERGPLGPGRPLWAAIMENFRLARLQVKGLQASFDGYRESVAFTLDEASATGVGRFKADEVLLRGLSLETFFDWGASTKLVGFSLKGLDLGPLIDRLPADDSPEDLPELTLADFVTAPFALDSVSLDGFSFEGPSGMAVSLARFSTTGPYGPGRIPPKSSTTISALTLTAPEWPPEDLDMGIQTFIILMNSRGLGSLTFSHAGECLYEETTGRYGCRYGPVLGESGLGDLNYSFSVTGLTPSAVKRMDSIPAHAITSPEYAAELGSLLSGIELEGMALDLANRGLVELLFGLRADETGLINYLVPADMLDAFYRYASDHLAGGRSLVGAAIHRFSREPRRLVLGINPAAPAAASRPDDAPMLSAEALNDLGLSLAVNDEAPIKLRFR
jgi:hypothetical protein